MLRGFGFAEGDTLLDLMADHEEIDEQMADYDMEESHA